MSRRSDMVYSLVLPCEGSREEGKWAELSAVGM